MRKGAVFGLTVLGLLGSAPAAHAYGDPVVGAVVGGVTGAVIGSAVGGGDGAIVGGVLGAAAGTALATRPVGVWAPAPYGYAHVYGGPRYRYYHGAPPVYGPYPAYGPGYGAVVVAPPPVYYPPPRVVVAPPVYVSPPVVYPPGHRAGWHRGHHGHRRHW